MIGPTTANRLTVAHALQQYGDLLPYHLGRNEQAMVHIAAGYARQRNRLGTYVCTSSVGPGATNMVTGAALATVSRLPVLLLPGDTFAGRLPHPVLQQIEVPGDGTASANDCFRPVSRYFDRIQRPEQLYSAALEAMRVLTDPADTGAVTLALPEDVQTEAFEWEPSFLSERVWTIYRQPPAPEALARAAELIRSAQRPPVIAGGGVIYSKGTKALRAFVDATAIPVAETQAGRGALVSEHPLSLGTVGATGGTPGNRLAHDADLVIGIGTQWSDFTTSSKSAFQDPGVRFINVNVAALDAAKHAGLPLLADARVVLEQLSDALAGHRAPHQWSDRAAAWAKRVATIVLAEGLGARAIKAETVDELRAALAETADAAGPVVICVETDRYAGVPGFEGWWDVPVSETSDRPEVQAALETYRAGRADQRIYLERP